jgi:hypothetical protein
MEAIRFSETLVTSCKTTGGHTQMTANHGLVADCLPREMAPVNCSQSCIYLRLRVHEARWDARNKYTTLRITSRLLKTATSWRPPAVLEMGRYMPVYHTGTFCSWISYRHLSIYIISTDFFSIVPCLAFKKYTGTPKFPFRALVPLKWRNITDDKTFQILHCK